LFSDGVRTEVKEVLNEQTLNDRLEQELLRANFNQKALGAVSWSVAISSWMRGLLVKAASGKTLVMFVAVYIDSVSDFSGPVDVPLGLSLL